MRGVPILAGSRPMDRKDHSVSGAHSVTTTRDPIGRFQRRRWFALIGSASPGGTLLFALPNGKVDIVAGSLAWGLVGASVVVAAWAFVDYRCTACGRFPEAEIPLFNPARCCQCGAVLRSESRS